MPLNIQGLIVFFDLETTETKVDTDRIVQISLLKYNPDGTEEIKTLLVNPGVPFPKEAVDVHGITDELVEDSLSKKILENNSQISPSYV